MSIIDNVYPDGSPVSKADVRSNDRTSIRRNMPSVQSVRDENLSGQYAGIYVRELQANFDLDTGSTAEDDGGTSCITDFAGNVFKRLQGGDVAGDTHAASSKANPVDADELPLVDSAASNVLRKLTWANLKTALASTFLTPSAVRERLSANRTYYVRSADGSDSNDGLADTSGGAFLTIQKAIDSVSMIDLSAYGVTIQLVGNFTETPLLKSYVGAGPVIIVGDETTPSNVTITGTGAQAGIFQADTVSGRWDVRGVKLTSTNKIGIYATNNSVVGFQNVDFGSVGSAAHISAQDGSIITATGNWSISGGASIHAQALQGGLVRIAFRTIIITGTPAFSVAFVSSTNVSSIRAQSMIFSGSATGVRFLVNTTSNLFTNGGGASYFPGDASGTADAATYGAYS